MFLTLLYPIVLGAALQVDAEANCPEPAQVSANVQKMVDLSTESAGRVHATLTRDGTWLVLNLAEADGTSLGERRLAYEGDCALLARAAAVVFAAWLSDEHPEFLVTLPPAESPAPADTAPSTAVSRSAPPPARIVTQPPAEPAKARVTAPRAAATQSSKPTHRIAVSAAIGGTASGTQFAPTALLALSWDPVVHGFGARLSVAWSGARSQPLLDAAHEVSWTRWPLLAGAFVRLPRGRFSFDLEAGAALSWLRLQGRGFEPNNASDSGASFGGYAAVRFVPQDAPLHAFVQAAPVLWAGRANAKVAASAVSTQLPNFELLISLGAQLPL